MSAVIDKFLTYVKIDTQSKPDTEQVPSTGKQLDLAKLLVEELKALKAQNVRLSENGYVYATIPANTDRPLKSLGFIAHIDTSCAVSGTGVNPRIVKQYDGGDIVLNSEQSIVLSAKEYPEIRQYQGQDLIVTDGRTLLGADDKAGVAEIMAMVQYLQEHPELTHGPIQIAFTPDEEVGRGADFFDVQAFSADFAYTVDGGELGELEYENFNAACVKLVIHGTSIHPGSAKNKMRNAILLANEFISLLPCGETPAHTEGYEGFYHVEQLSGTCEEARLECLIRDHDRELFENKKERIQKICAYLNDQYGQGTFEPVIRDNYYNMKEAIEPHMHLIHHAVQAMQALQIEPKIVPIRGGTDGSRLSYMGLPCPNLCTGGHNFHGRYEYICVQSMEKIVELLVKIVELYAKP